MALDYTIQKQVGFRVALPDLPTVQLVDAIPGVKHDIVLLGLDQNTDRVCRWQYRTSRLCRGILLLSLNHPSPHPRERKVSGGPSIRLRNIRLRWELRFVISAKIGKIAAFKADCR